MSCSNRDEADKVRRSKRLQVRLNSVLPDPHSSETTLPERPCPAESASRLVVEVSTNRELAESNTQLLDHAFCPAGISDEFDDCELYPTSSPSSFLTGFSDSEPAVLTIGTEVSAKYKGAFCEARIKSISRLVKCRVSLKGPGPSVVVTDENITGPLRVGASVEAKHNSNVVEGTITKIMDGSQYTVIFDDGDETTLKRTSLCLKSGKHYSESESLDHLPLTNPEHFGNPVRGGRAKRKRFAALITGGTSTASSLPYASSDVDDNESAEGDTVTGSLDGDDDTASNLTQQSLPKDEGKDEDSRSLPPTPKTDPLQESIGRVFVVEYSEKRGNKAKDTWYPALVVSPTTTEQNSIRVNPAEEFLVKSFKDNRFYSVNQKNVKPFDRAIYSSLTDANSSAALRSAIDKCITYTQSGDLPASWDSDLLLGSFLPNSEEAGVGSSELDSLPDEDIHHDSGRQRDEQPSEEKDRFVAQLYKFMDERGTPINRAPSVSGKDLDLYRLYTLVNEMGGYNKITTRDIWKSVYLKSDLPACSSDSHENSAINQLKAAYKKYLLNFTEFYRKLGYPTSFVNSPIASRASSRPARNERSWRLSGLDSAAAASGTVPAVKETPPAKGGRRRKSAAETEAKIEDVSQEADDSKNDADDSSVTGRRGSLKKNIRKLLPGRRKTGPKADSSESEEAAAPPECIPDPGLGPDMDSDTETDVSAVKTISKDVEVNTGDKIRVKYIKGPKEHIYEAKIINSEKNADPAKHRFLVHYAGWNTRYDEWIDRSRIVQVIKDKIPKRRGGIKGMKRGPPPEVLEQERLEAKLLEAATPSKRSRGAAALPVTGGRLSTDSTKTIPPSAKIAKIASGKKLRRGGDADAATESCDEILSKNEDSLASSVSYPDASGKDDTVGHENEADMSDAVRDVKPAPAVYSEPVEAPARRPSIDSSSTRSRSHRETASSSSAGLVDVKSEDQSRRVQLHHDRDSNDSTEEDEVVRSAHSAIHKRRRTKSARDRKETGAESDPCSKAHTLESETKRKFKLVRGRHRDEVQKAELEDRRTTDRKRKPVSPNRSEDPVPTELDDEKLKRKRGAKELRVAETCSKKPEELTAKSKGKRDENDHRVKKEDDDVNQEIARLFDDDKTTASETAGQLTASGTSGKENATTSSDNSSTFLLCREEVPLSPVAASAAAAAVVADATFDPSSSHSKAASGDSARDEKDSARDEYQKSSDAGNNNFSPPTTPESLRSGTLSSLTPPHEREGQDGDSGKSCNQNVSSSNSDAEANEICASKTRPHAPTKNAIGSPPHLSDDSGCSRGPTDGGLLKDLTEKHGRIAEGSGSPKRKKRGRARASSTSEPVAGNDMESARRAKYMDKHAGYKTRGSSAKKSSRYQDHDRYSPVGSASDQPGSHPISPVSGISLSQIPPNAFFASIQPISKYNFCTPLPEDLDSERRIQILNDRIQELRKTYMNLKSELVAVERRKKKCRRKAGHANSSNNNHSSSSSSGQEKRLVEKSMSMDLSSDASDKPSNARDSSA